MPSNFGPWKIQTAFCWKLTEVRVWDPPQAALIWGSVRHFSLLWRHRLKVFPRRRVYYIFLWFCFSSTEIQQIICKFFHCYRRAVLLSPCDATLKAHEGKPISLSSDTRVLGFYAFRCATHTHAHAGTHTVTRGRVTLAAALRDETHICTLTPTHPGSVPRRKYSDCILASFSSGWWQVSFPLTRSE